MYRLQHYFSMAFNTTRIYRLWEPKQMVTGNEWMALNFRVSETLEKIEIFRFQKSKIG